MQRVHNFFDRGIIVPPMDVQQVDVRSAEFLQASLDTDVHRLSIVSGIVGLLYNRVVSALEVCGVLKGNHGI